MSVEKTYGELEELLQDYLSPLGMRINDGPSGPLRAAGELVAGMVFTGSVQLTNAARRTAPDAAELDRHVKRLSLALADPHWDHRPWAAQVLALQARQVQELDLLPLDATELAKPYAKKMEHQGLVRDGSRPEHPLVRGYGCYGAYRYRPTQGILSPLLLRPYSQDQPGFLSENDVWLNALRQLRHATGGRGIGLLDRGGDRPEILADLLRWQPRWIVRLQENRALLGPDGTRRSALAWAREALGTGSERGHAVTLPVSLPPEDVPQFDPVPPLYLLVPTYEFRRNGKPERWILLVCGLMGHHVGPRQVRHDYGGRWRAEGAKRFLGQIWHVERFMTRSFLALERMLWCLVLAGGFLAMLEEQEAPLAEALESEVLYLSKRLKVPEYRLARGILAVAGQDGPPTMLVNA